MYSRYGLGYDSQGKYWNRVLPYNFDLYGAECSPARVWDPTHGEEGEPNWYVVDREGKTIAKPGEKKGKGKVLLLKSDILLLTVAPNTFTREAYDAVYRHFIIAGAHGPAVKALRQVLDNKEILKEIEHRVFFQAIIRIPKLEVTDEGYEPEGKPLIIRIEDLDDGDFKQYKPLGEWA